MILRVCFHNRLNDTLSFFCSNIKRAFFFRYLSFVHQLFFIYSVLTAVPKVGIAEFTGVWIEVHFVWLMQSLTPTGNQFLDLACELEENILGKYI